MKSWFAKCLAVRRVTQDNQGKKTAGVDGVKSLTPQQRITLIGSMELKPGSKPVRRVWIPKPGKDEKRPLGIPTMDDRALQALLKMALEPEWEAKFEPNSYGFRPGRSAHDAIEAIFTAIAQKSKFVLDADIAQCFDRINHEALLRKLRTFPVMERVIRGWLKAGVMDGGNLFPTPEGNSKQGGARLPLQQSCEKVVSPPGNGSRNSENHVNPFLADLHPLHQGTNQLPLAMPIQLIQSLSNLRAKLF